MTSFTLAQRREILASMPWVAVSPVDFKDRCEGLLVDRPLYVRLHMTEQEQRTRYGCHKRARWVYVSVHGEIRIFCWWHLAVYGFEGTQEDMKRYQTWVDTYLQTHLEPPDWSAEEPDEPLSQQQ